MEPLVLEQFKQTLETMLVDLKRFLRRRDEIAIENTPDALDEVQNAAERELAIRQLEHDSSRFRTITAALQRIEDGTYGQCVQCESGISIKRLKAVPWTPYCLDCQDLADHNPVEAESDVVQFTDRGPKIMRAGQPAGGSGRSSLLEQPVPGESDEDSAGNEPAGLSEGLESPRKRVPASERLQRRTKQSA